jgi:hypothetical protein
VKQHLLATFLWDDNKPEEMSWEVVHPDDCPMAETSIGDDEGRLFYQDYDCNIGRLLRDYGEKAFSNPIPKEEGHYRLMYWSTQVGVEREDGIGIKEKVALGK